MIKPIIKYYPNGNKCYEQYYLNDNLHNPNGAAKISYYANGNKQVESYWINGKLHNPNGPAVIKYDENGNKSYEQYWFNDIQFNNKENMDKYIKLHNLS